MGGSSDSWRPYGVVCFYTNPEDALTLPINTKREVIFLFCAVPIVESTGALSDDAINAVFDYADEIRKKITNEYIWIRFPNCSGRITYKKNGERSSDEFDFSLNIWRKLKSHMA